MTRKHEEEQNRLLRVKRSLAADVNPPIHRGAFYPGIPSKLICCDDADWLILRIQQSQQKCENFKTQNRLLTANNRCLLAERRDLEELSSRLWCRVEELERAMAIPQEAREERAVAITSPQA